MLITFTWWFLEWQRQNAKPLLAMMVFWSWKYDGLQLAVLACALEGVLEFGGY